MRWFRTFIGGILAGISIAIGGTVFLSLENKPAADLAGKPGRYPADSPGGTGDPCGACAGGKGAGNLYGQAE